MRCNLTTFISHNYVFKVSVKPKQPTLTSRPAATFLNGTKVNLICEKSPDDKGNTTYKFLFDDGRIEESADSNYTFTVSSSDSGHMETYTCIAVVNGIESQASDELNVLIGLYSV